MWKEAESFRPLNDVFAHVVDIKQASSCSNSKMLLNDAGIFDGHVPPAKLGHPGTQFLVQGMKSSFSQAEGGRIHDAWRTKEDRSDKKQRKTSIGTHGCQTEAAS